MQCSLCLDLKVLHESRKADVNRGAILGVDWVCIDPRCTCYSRVGLSYSCRYPCEPDFFCTFVDVASPPRDTRTPPLRQCWALEGIEGDSHPEGPHVNLLVTTFAPRVVSSLQGERDAHLCALFAPLGELFLVMGMRPTMWGNVIIFFLACLLSWVRAILQCFAKSTFSQYVSQRKADLL